jgi:hypothetical protein
MSKEYGYIGKEVTQAFRDNKGIFTPQDIIELDQENKWTNFGQLEHISTTVISSGTTNVDILSIQENNFKTHFITLNDMTGASGGGLEMQYYENLGGTQTLETASVYQWEHQNNFSNGTHSESRNTISYLAYGNTGLPNNGYIYLYNAGDNTKNTYMTWVSSNWTGTLQASCWGSNVMTQASIVNGIRFRISSSSINFTSGSISLYGIKEYS